MRLIGPKHWRWSLILIIVFVIVPSLPNPIDEDAKLDAIQKVLMARLGRNKLRNKDIPGADAVKSESAQASNGRAVEALKIIQDKTANVSPEAVKSESNNGTVNVSEVMTKDIPGADAVKSESAQALQINTGKERLAEALKILQDKAANVSVKSKSNNGTVNVSEILNKSDGGSVKNSSTTRNNTIIDKVDSSGAEQSNGTILDKIEETSAAVTKQSNGTIHDKAETTKPEQNNGTIVDKLETTKVVLEKNSGTISVKSRMSNVTKKEMIKNKKGNTNSTTPNSSKQVDKTEMHEKTEEAPKNREETEKDNSEEATTTDEETTKEEGTGEKPTKNDTLGETESSKEDGKGNGMATGNKNEVSESTKVSGKTPSADVSGTASSDSETPPSETSASVTPTPAETVPPPESPTAPGTTSPETTNPDTADTATNKDPTGKTPETTLEEPEDPSGKNHNQTTSAESGSGESGETTEGSGETTEGSVETTEGTEGTAKPKKETEPTEKDKTEEAGKSTDGSGDGDGKGTKEKDGKSSKGTKETEGSPTKDRGKPITCRFCARDKDMMRDYFEQLWNGTKENGTGFQGGLCRGTSEGGTKKCKGAMPCFKYDGSKGTSRGCAGFWTKEKKWEEGCKEQKDGATICMCKEKNCNNAIEVKPKMLITLLLMILPLFKYIYIRIG